MPMLSACYYVQPDDRNFPKRFLQQVNYQTNFESVDEILN